MKETMTPQKIESTTLPQTAEEPRMLRPTVDIFEVPDGLAVVADLPGVDKSDVDIRVEKDILTIRGTVRPQMPGEMLYREYDLLSYFRQFQLTDEVDQDKIKAEMKHGVLTVHLPKAEKAKPKRISVNVAT